MSLQIFAATLVVPEYDAGIAFYCGVLGFELREDVVLSAQKRWVMVAPEGTETALLLAKAVGQAQAAAIGNQTGGRVGFFLHTDDFDAEYARLLAAGVTFCEAPRTEAYGKVVVFVDPWGNRWDLLQRLG